MSDYFSIRLDADTVEAGTALTGRVVFPQPSEAFEKATAVVLELTYEVSGSGDPEMSKTFKTTIHSGPVFAPTEIRFSARLPSHLPCTYRGQHVNIDWRVAARVDVAWALDPSAQEKFFIVPRKLVRPALAAGSSEA